MTAGERASSGHTRAQLLAEAERLLVDKSGSPRLDAQLLLAFVLGIERSRLILDQHEPVVSMHVERFRDLVNRRAGHEPIAYLTGTKEFFGRDFYVSSAVLIPRPESELIVETALSILSNQKDSEAVRFLDLGTGSGCLVCSLVAELSEKQRRCNGVAVDLSPDALSVARRNAEQLKVAEQIHFLCGNWFHPLADAEYRGPKVFDLIVANPPYVSNTEPVSPEISHEPQQAIFAEDHGLKEVRKIIRLAPQRLASGGHLLIEVGAFKRVRCREMFENEKELTAPWESILYLGDASDEDRFTVLHLIKAGSGTTSGPGHI